MAEDEKSGICATDSHKELLSAFQYRNIAKFKNILSSENTNINKVYGDPHYGTILDIVCREKGNVEYVQELLNFGADPNIIDKTRKQAPLHYAVLAGDEETVKLLLTNDSTDVNIKNSTGSTPLHLSVKQNQKNIITLLLNNKKVNINAPNRKGNTPLHEAIREQNIDLVKQFIQIPNINLEAQNYTEQTIRELICQQYPQLEKLLPQEIQKGQHTADEMFTLLRRQNIDTFIDSIKENRHLLENNDGYHTFLQYCCDFGIEKAVQEMLDIGINPNTTHAANIQTPLMVAASKGFCSILSILVNNEKTSYEAVNNETALHCIVKGSSEAKGLAEMDIEKDYTKCLKILLRVPRSKLDINQKDNRGNTALHYAAKQGAHEMVLMLLNAGAYIGIRNKNNEPACSDISYATFQAHLDTCVFTNDKLPREDNYGIIFNYKCLIPYEQNTLGSSNSLQNIIDIESYPGNMYNCESEPLLYMTQNRELKALLKHPIFTSFLHLKWHKIRTYFFINLILYLIFCLLFTGYILTSYGTKQANSTAEMVENGGGNFLWTLVSFFLLILVLREVFQLTLSPSKYISNPENWLEMGIIGIAIAILFCTSCLSMKHQVSAIGILLSWAEAVLLIGRHPALSTNIEMFKTVSWNFLKFLAWYSILIIAFALSFHSLFRDVQEEDNLFEDPGISVFKTVVMLTGEFDTGSIPFIQYPVTSHLLFVLFVFLIAIVLFNLLNGLAVSDTQAIKSDAELVSYISRVKLISYIERTLYNPSSCNLSQYKSIFCCVSNLVNSKRKNLFSKKINLFENISSYEIRIYPNLKNKVDDADSKMTNDETNCINDCNFVHMDIEIVKAAKEILVKKECEREKSKENRIMMEKEQKLNQMLIECKETLEKNKEMLEQITTILNKMNK